MLIPNPLAALPDPSQRVLSGPSASFTAQQLVSAVRRRAACLHASGVRAQSIVAIHAENTEDFVVRLHAIGWLNAAAMVLPSQYTAHEEAALLSAQEPDFFDRECDAAPDETGPIEARDWSLSDVRLYVRSSGSSGAARWVKLLTHQLFFSAMGSTIRLGHLPGDRWICALPLDHIGGLSIVFRCIWLGTEVDLLSRFDAAEVIERIHRGATHLSAVPQMLGRIIDQLGNHAVPPSFRVALIGGAPCSDQLVERSRLAGVPIARSWGMTEAASQVCTHVAGDYGPARFTPTAFAKVTQVGERLQISGPLVERPLLTADRGAIDADGRVRVLGRADAIIISGGENIDPTEVEDAARSHPQVIDCVAVGISDPRWGERLMLLYEGGRGLELAPFLSERLAPYKRPKAIIWLKKLPRSSLGKIQRGAAQTLATAHKE